MQTAENKQEQEQAQDPDYRYCGEVCFAAKSFGMGLRIMSGKGELVYYQFINPMAFPAPQIITGDSFKEKRHALKSACEILVSTWALK